MPSFGMLSYACGPCKDSWEMIGLLSLPWRGRPGNKIILDSQKLHKPVLAEIPYWISASFQVRPWLFLIWAFRLLILALLEPQTGQQNGFSPVCILMCIISFCFEMNFLLHWSHWWSQDSCLRKDIVEVLRIRNWEKTSENWKSNSWSNHHDLCGGQTFTPSVSSHRGRVHCASDAPFHKCHSTSVFSPCAASAKIKHFVSDHCLFYLVIKQGVFVPSWEVASWFRACEPVGLQVDVSAGGKCNCNIISA